MIWLGLLLFLAGGLQQQHDTVEHHGRKPDTVHNLDKDYRREHYHTRPYIQCGRLMSLRAAKMQMWPRFLIAANSLLPAGSPAVMRAEAAQFQRLEPRFLQLPELWEMFSIACGTR